jgi:glycosyltransferase involved in cell wall biosynthesis
MVAEGEGADRSSVTAVPGGAGRALRILGTRGIPAGHGGFETFAERLALYLVARGWRVTVYCQATGDGALSEDEWRGVRRVHCPVSARGALGTVVFDWRTTRHAAAAGETVLTLGYNTAIFCALYNLHGVRNLINMDGFEWRRGKWSRPAKAWLRLNEQLGCRLGDHLIADHPRIEEVLGRYVRPDKITMIPYGADVTRQADVAPLAALGLEPGSYALIVARLEPENSILQILRSFSSRMRSCELVVLGSLAESNPYHRELRAAANSQVRFFGAIYDQVIVSALRSSARLYVHGHTVGGTNPSLVEAMGAGSPILAHDNVFNRWVAGSGAAYFHDEADCGRQFDELLDDRARLARMAEETRARCATQFSWPKVLGEYEALLARWVSGGAREA